MIVYFEYKAWWLFLVGSAVFVLGSVLDILDGALARSQGQGTPFGAFLDSTLDRVGEAFMLGAIGLVFMRDDKEWAVAMTFAAIVGSFLVSYTRAKAEIIGLKGDVGIGSRAERVAVICIGLALAPVGALPWAVVDPDRCRLVHGRPADALRPAAAGLSLSASNWPASTGRCECTGLIALC